MFARTISLFIICLVLTVFAGVSQTNAATARIGMIASVGGTLEDPFNGTAWNGVLDAQEQLGVEGTFFTAQQESDIDLNINTCIAEGYDLIITMGFDMTDVTASAAQANPGSNFAIVDVSYDPPIDNLMGIVYAIDEACFMGGYLAAGVTKTGKVGVYGGMNFPPVTLFMDGFALGVECYNEKHGTSVEALGWDPATQTGIFAGTFVDTDVGRSIAETLMDQGADIILPAAGATSMGSAAAAKERGGVYVIGVDNDWVMSAPEYADITLTSALKKMDVTVFDVIKQVVDGTFQGGTYLGTLENDGVGLAPYHELASMVPVELQAELDEIKQGIIADEIETTPPAPKPIKVGLLTDLGPVDDNSFNETAWNGILKAQEEFGIDAVYRESYEEPEWEPNMNALLEEEACDLIVTMGFYLADITDTTAQANPDGKFAIVDFSYDPAIDNVVGIEYAIDEACFLIGYLAAGITETGKIATYGGMDIPPVTLFMDGFVMGAEYYNKKHGKSVEVLGWDPATQTGLFVDTFIDMEAGRNMGAKLMDEGADIVFPICGIPGTGTAAVAQERGNAYVIGVDTDMTMSAPDYADVYLTSALKKMDVTVFDVIKQVVDGTFQGGTYLGTLENDGVGLAPYHELASMVSAELQAELDEIKQGIISGEIPTNPREIPEEDYSNVFFMSLPPGLNMISLPLKPRTAYTARSLAEEIGATIVIKYDTELGKFVGYALGIPDLGFDIEGGQGYIVNVPQGRTVAFTGAAWTNEPTAEAAPPLSQNNSAWAFVVSGSVFHDGLETRCDTPLNVTVKNLRTGTIATETVNSGGYFAAAWADLTRDAVIQAGDRMEITVMDSNGQVASGPFVHEVTMEGIRDAVMSVRLKLDHVIPAKSALLQNYPNPFNPETWIPYQLRKPSTVSIRIYNSTGVLIRTLEIGHRDAGLYLDQSRAAFWDGKTEAGEEAASGIYFYSITTGDFSATRKMIVKK